MCKNIWKTNVEGSSSVPRGSVSCLFSSQTLVEMSSLSRYLRMNIMTNSPYMINRNRRERRIEEKPRQVSDPCTLWEQLRELCSHHGVCTISVVKPPTEVA